MIYFVEVIMNTKLPQAVLSLHDIFKGDTGETINFVAVTAKIKMGLEIRYWVERGIMSRKKQGVTQGYLFINSKREILRSKDSEVGTLDLISRTQQEHPDLIRPGLEMHEEYTILRSFQRG